MKIFFAVADTKITVKYLRDLLNDFNDNDIINIKGPSTDNDLDGEYEKIYRIDNVVIREDGNKKEIDINISFYDLEKYKD